MIGEIIWTRHYIIDEVFMLYQSMREFQNSSCEIDHMVWDSATKILFE
jgi:hypothetical protein